MIGEMTEYADRAQHSCSNQNSAISSRPASHGSAETYTTQLSE